MNKLKMIINTFLFRFKLLKRNINISMLAFLDNKCNLTDNIKVDRFCVLHSVSIDKYSYIGFNSHIKNCKIGKFCSISSDVKIGLGNHPTQMVSTSPIFYSNDNPFSMKWVSSNSFEEYEQVNIGNDVWIGTNVVIMGGINIGDGSIIGAGSIVTKDVAPYSVVVGAPAKVIKKRFKEDEIEILLKMRWWEWDDELLKNKIQCFADIESFIDDYKING